MQRGNETAWLTHYCIEFLSVIFFLWHFQCLGTHSSSMLIVLYGCFAMSNI